MKNRNSISGHILLLSMGLLLASALPSSAQHSLYRDVKANQIGDIITVVLMENISGSSTSDSRQTSSTSGQASGSTSSNFLPFEPYFGTDASVGYNSDDRNLANQRQLLQGHMSVQITEITDRGDMIVSGNRVTEINGELHEITLRGTVRPNDVDSANRVLSYRVANAEINYQKKEGLKQMTRKPGFIRRVAFIGVGVAMSAAIIARELN
ncbi:flagellar basal body L-ring protein FlgH [Balneolales bacterium ANBcel1]|nr:flagellar basal body L-ring protein FlgH [Balneolales bacterium ANBcel1]